jgi:hypothetical protein
VTDVKRTKRKWFLNENAPGATEENIEPGRIDPELLAKIREEFGPNPEMGSPQGMVMEDFCVEIGLEGCYCKIPEAAQGTVEGQLQQDYTKEYDYVVEDTVSSPDWDATQRVVTGPDGQPTVIDPIVHQLKIERDAADQPVVPTRYIRRTRYHGQVKFNLKLVVYKYQGVCTPVRELSEDEEEYFVKRQRESRLERV